MSFKDSLHTYTALSYAWGDSSMQEVIRIANSKMTVNVSLFHALRAARHSSESVLLWADAICINQQDEIEKGSQVKRMGKIFQNARAVMVYLGDDSEGLAHDTFNLVKEANIYFEHQRQTHGHPQHIPIQNLETDDISKNLSRWGNVNKLLDLPWFSRLWVVQEVGLAKKVSALWGDASINLAEIFELSNWLYQRPDFASCLKIRIPERKENVFLIGHCSFGTRNSWKEDLPYIRTEAQDLARNGRRMVEILDVGRSLDALLDIDRVYAFLGSPLAIAVDVDYSKNSLEVYSETARRLLSHPWEAPFALSFVDHHDQECIESSDFPSWVPRWDKGSRVYAIGMASYWFQAGVSWTFQAEVQPDNSLWLPSVVFDHIRWISAPINMHNLSLNPDDWEERTRASGIPFIDYLWTQVMQGWDRIAAGSQDFPKDITYQQLQTAFSLTLVRHYPRAHFPGHVDGPYHDRNFASYRELVRTKINPQDESLNELDQPVSGDAYHFCNHVSNTRHFYRIVKGREITS